DEVQDLVALRAVTLPAVVRERPVLLDGETAEHELELRRGVQEDRFERLLLHRPEHRARRIEDRTKAAEGRCGREAEQRAQGAGERRREITETRRGGGRS